ncbi:hypothetical protein ZWY2020_006098 [Hordeum vulgare]|nr:hypothetical protein ZWY2020_006098 [Hordeum vulgare]
MPTSCQLLEYLTLIHVGRIREHEGPERWLCPANSDGSGQSGLPEDSGGFSSRGEWQVLPWTRGVRDHHDGMQPSGAQGGSYRQALLGRIGPSNWRITPMVNATERFERNRVVATPSKEPSSSAGQAAVTTATRLAPTESALRWASESAGVAHRATQDPSDEREGAAEVGQSTPSFDQGRCWYRTCSWWRLKR